MKRTCEVATLAVVALLTTACGTVGPAVARETAAKAASAGQAVTVTMTDVQFSPATVTVKTGTPVAVTATNKGMLEHNWVAKIGSETIQLDARPGQTSTKTFTPSMPGTYGIVCTVPGHEQAGMTGTLVAE